MVYDWTRTDPVGERYTDASLFLGTRGPDDPSHSVLERGS